MGMSWRATLDTGAAVLVADAGAGKGWCPAVVRRRTYGGGCWVQLTVEDPSKPGGLRRCSLPLASDRLAPLAPTDFGAYATQLALLAEHESLALAPVPAGEELAEAAAEPAAQEAPVREAPAPCPPATQAEPMPAPAEVTLTVCTLGGDGFTQRVSRDASLSDLLLLASATCGAPAGELDLILGAEVLGGLATRPLAAVEEEVTLHLLRQVPVKRVRLSLETVERWESLVMEAEAGSILLDVRVPVPEREHLELIGRFLRDKPVVALSMRHCTLTAADVAVLAEHIKASVLRNLNLSSALPLNGLSLLKDSLPCTLEDLDLSGVWANATLMQCMALLHEYARDVEQVVHASPRLRVLRLRGTQAASREVDIASLIKLAVARSATGCALEL